MNGHLFRLAMTMRKEQQDYGNKLEVMLLDRLVGTIKLGQNDKSIFEFDSDYLADSNRPVLSLFFRTKSGGINERTSSYRMKVDPFFSNMLPEGHLREYLATKLGINEEREFYLLAALGSDLPGAVIITPSNIDKSSAHRSPDVEEERKESSEILKFSLAGVQLKFSAVLESSGGLTIHAAGADGDHIVKLPSSKYDLVPEAEHASLCLAKIVGIDTAESKLIKTSDIGNLPKDITALTQQSLSVKRFDRNPGGRRIHIEDFAQVFGLFPDEKYKKAAYHDLANVIWQISGEHGLTEFIRRLVFTIGIGNGDMHLKNWSLIYRDGVTPELSPAYDFVPTIAFHEDRKLALSIGGEKVMTKVTLEHFAKLAGKADVPSRLVETIVKETIESFHTSWIENRDSLSFPSFARESIESQIQNSELFRMTPGTRAKASEDELVMRYFFLAGLAGNAGSPGSSGSAADFYNRALSADASKDWKSAVRLYSASIAESPVAQAYYNRGNSKVHLNDLQEAIADYATSLTLMPIPQAAYNAGLTHWNISRNTGEDKGEAERHRELAVTYFRDSIRMDPKLAEAWYNLGVLHVAKEPAESYQNFKAAAEINAYFMEAVFNMAVALFLNLQYDSALEQFEKAVALETDLDQYRFDFEKRLTRIIRLVPISGAAGPIGPKGPSSYSSDVAV